MLTTVLYIVACVLLFALAILVHEFGHFIVALKLGLKVDAFSIGFGPALWKKTWRGVEYRLSAIPLGGYVSIPDIDPEGTKALEGGQKADGKKKGDDKAKEAVQDAGKASAAAEPPGAPIPPWKEILVAAAGPMMNIVLAVVLAFVLAAVPSAKFGETPAEVDVVLPESAAEKGGLRSGDRIVSIGGRPIATWTEMQTEVQISGGRETPFVVERADAGGAAAQVTLAVAPEKDDVTGAYFIGAVNTNGCGAAAWMPARSPWQQLAWDAGSIFRVLKGLVTPKEAKATAGALGGPVMIAEGIYRSMRRNAWDGLGFLRFLNVNLAILNLLPIPVLDGGLIFFALIALLCRRRVPACVVKYASLAFMVLLMGLMGLLIVRDSWRSYRIHTSDRFAGCGAATNAVERQSAPAGAGAPEAAK